MTLADFHGKTVIVQSMGIGCTPCTDQQHRSAKVLPNFSNDQVAYVSLDVVPGQTNSQLLAYANENNFPWTFATNTDNLLRTLIQKFGLSVVNIDSVPMFVISPRGNVSSLYTGGMSESDLTHLVEDQAKN